MKFFTVKPTRIEINSELSEVQMWGFSIDLEQNSNAVYSFGYVADGDIAEIVIRRIDAAEVLKNAIQQLLLHWRIHFWS